ncbi:MAG: hypothetical protein K6G52_04835 [Treponemataceae bacterium]|nr:hypothetical protein [Treponemataceae bacterium]
MKNDIRFVHREESFEDIAVQELAASQSACICRLQFGRCKQEECESCHIGKEFQNCYEHLSDYDRVRLSKYVSRQYVQDSLHRKNG